MLKIQSLTWESLYLGNMVLILRWTRLLENIAVFCWDLFCVGHINKLGTCMWFMYWYSSGLLHLDMEFIIIMCSISWNAQTSFISIKATDAQTFLYKTNFMIIWSSGPFWHFCSLKCFRPSFVGFSAKKLPAFWLTVWTLNQIYTEFWNEDDLEGQSAPKP